MKEDNFDEESSEDEADSREDTSKPGKSTDFLGPENQEFSGKPLGVLDEELENIIDETESTSELTPFRQAALEDILPILKERETQTLEQGIANIGINEEEENEEQQGIYDLQQTAQETGYESVKGVYQQPSSIYDLKQQTPDGGSGRIMDFRNQQNQNFQQSTIGQQPQNQGFEQRQYEIDKEKEIKENRKRRFW